MREESPGELIDLLQRLQLATAEQVHEVYPQVQRLARDLPLFQSVWVDALLQAGQLTRFQAAEINAGRGVGLKIGPYVLLRWLDSLGYAESFLARRTDDSSEEVRLLVADAGKRSDEMLPKLEAVVKAQLAIHDEVLVPIHTVGVDNGRVWLASSAVGNASSRTTADWLIHQGRFSPEASRELARQMCAALSVLEKLGLEHGDLSAKTTLVDVDGHVRVLWPGVRAILRPDEGFAHADLQAECLDYLAPERVADGTGPNATSDLFSCGALWWHLLTGRTPLVGGNSITKLQAGQTQRIPSVRRFAPETVPELVQAVTACLSRQISERPKSFAKLSAAIGPATRLGVLAIREYCHFAPDDRRNQPGVNVRQTADALKKSTSWIITAAAVLLVLGVLTWPVWRGHVSWPGQSWLSWIKKTDKPNTGGASSSSNDSATPRHSSSDDSVATNQLQNQSFAQQASHQQNLPNDMVINANSVADPNQWDIQPGQTVRGAPGKRMRIEVPAIGWQIHVEDVHFENLDFVSAAEAIPSNGDESSERCLIDLRCQRATFDGCTFNAGSNSTKDESRLPSTAAIRWSGAGVKRTNSLRAAGRLEVANCIFNGGNSAIDWCGAGPMLIEAENSLANKTNTFVRLIRCPHGDELTSIRMNRFTQRGGNALLTLPSPKVGEEPAAISIQAVDSVFSADQAGSLIVVQGVGAPGRLMKSILWSGQGSILSGNGEVAVWQSDRGNMVNVSDDLENIAGLARGTVDFAGPQVESAAASKVIRWTGPIQSSQPPGYRGNQ